MDPVSDALLVEILKRAFFVCGGGGGALENVLEDPVVIAIQSARERRPSTPADRAGHDFIVRARVRDHAQTDVWPEVALPAEPKWSANNRDDLRHAHRPEERNRPKNSKSGMPSCLGDHRRFGFSAERQQRVQLREQGFGPQPYTRSLEPGHPLCSLPCSVDTLSRRENGLGPEHRFDALHHPRRILDQIAVVANHLLERQHRRGAVIHALQRPDPQSLRQQVGIDLVVLVDQFLLPSHVANDDSLSDRLQQIVQPLRLRAFLERDVHPRPLAANQSDDGLRLRRHRRLEHDRPRLIPCRRHGRCLVHVQTEIMNPLILHGSRPFLSFGLRTIQTYKKGRAFNMR